VRLYDREVGGKYLGMCLLLLKDAFVTENIDPRMLPPPKWLEFFKEVSQRDYFHIYAILVSKWINRYQVMEKELCLLPFKLFPQEDEFSVQRRHQLYR